MNRSETQAAYEEEINLDNYWKVIVKSKKLIIGIFLIAIVVTTIISFLIPKIYKGEATLKLTTKELTTKELTTKELTTKELTTKELTTKELTTKELIDIIGKIDREKLERILPKTHQVVTKIELDAIKNSTDKLRVIIETEKAETIPDTLTEIVGYTNQNFLIKRYVEQEKEILSKKLEEISNNIESSKELINMWKTLFKSERIVFFGFNPIQLNLTISDLKIEKIRTEQAIKNLKGVEVINQYIAKKPVKPKIKMNIFVAGMISLFFGIFLAFFMEYTKKIKSR